MWQRSPGSNRISDFIERRRQTGLVLQVRYSANSAARTQYQLVSSVENSKL
jgi:hypothetical protein